MGMPQESLQEALTFDYREMSKGPTLNDFIRDISYHDHSKSLVDSALIERLAQAHPDLRRNDVTFGLVAAYVAGISENGEAVFPVQDNRTLASHGKYFPVRVKLHPEESFGMFLSHVLLSRIRMNGTQVSQSENDLQVTTSLALSFGHRTTPPKKAQIWLLCRDDGVIDWCHTSEVPSQTMAQMSRRMTLLAERILDDFGGPLSKQLAA